MKSYRSPIVSVIIPTYNRAHMLTHAIKSVLQQDIDSLEVLIIDDGSEDNTADYVYDIQAKDRRIRYFKLSENKGIGNARQVGMQNSRGKYIGFIDSDDRWLPGKLSCQIPILERFPEIDILFGNFWNIDHRRDTRTNAFAKTANGLRQLSTVRVAEDLFVIEDGFEKGLLVKMFVQLGTVLLRRHILEIAGNFEPLLRGAEDFEFCWRAAVHGARFAYSDKIWVERHVSEESITAQRADSWMKYLQALQICHDTAQQAQRPDLYPPLRAAEQRVWRNLIKHYGEQSRRVQVLKMYIRSLNCGFSSRNLIYLSAAILGPKALAYFSHILRHRQAWGYEG